MYGARRKGYILLDCSVSANVRLDRRIVHSEESVVFNGSIGVELDSEGSIVSAYTEH